MAIVKGANVTKYEAGGGDNTISDGFIKTVEKVWIDTYSVGAAIPSTTSILIGKVPAGKKLTDVIVYLPVLSGVATTGTVNCTTSIVGAGTIGTLGFLVVNGLGVQAANLATVTTLRLNATGALQELTADSDIYIVIDANAGVGTTTTAGTIRSIIKYT